MAGIQKYRVNLFYKDSNQNRQILDVIKYEKEGIGMIKFTTGTGCEVFKLDDVIGFNMIKVED